VKKQIDSEKLHRASNICDSWHWERNLVLLAKTLEGGHKKQYLSFLSSEEFDRVTAQANAWRYAQLEYPQVFGKCRPVGSRKFTAQEKSVLQGTGDKEICAILDKPRNPSQRQKACP
jgi:hypothetical protein